VPKITDFDFPEPPRAAPLVDRLQARAAAADAKPAPTLSESEEQARANLIAQLAVTSDPKEILMIANALVALDRVVPDEPDADALDLSDAPLEVLEWLADAEELHRTPPGPERDERIAKLRSERELEAQYHRAGKLCVAGRCTAKARATAPKPAQSATDGYPTSHAGEGWRR
jgi:hypothetical protein